MEENYFIETFKELKNQEKSTQSRFHLEWDERYPCLEDDTSKTNFDAHYIYHTAWAARVLARLRPVIHHDISSYLYFSTLVSAFIPIKFYDYRPAPVKVSGLTAEHADLLALPFADESIDSLSCMHVIEHIGLGRYGDKLDYDGDLKGIKELSRVLKKGGSLLLVVPVGTARICFNAHRIYSPFDIQEIFKHDFNLQDSALITDDPGNGIITQPSLSLMSDQKYGCGCFWFIKK